MSLTKHLIRIAAVCGVAIMLSGCVVVPVWTPYRHHVHRY